MGGVGTAGNKYLNVASERGREGGRGEGGRAGFRFTNGKVVQYSTVQLSTGDGGVNALLGCRMSDSSEGS